MSPVQSVDAEECAACRPSQPAAGHLPSAFPSSVRATAVELRSDQVFLAAVHHGDEIHAMAMVLMNKAASRRRSTALDAAGRSAQAEVPGNEQYDDHEADEEDGHDEYGCSRVATPAVRAGSLGTIRCGAG